LSLIVIEGANQIELYGQYWQYAWSELFYVEIPPPTRADILGEVPGQGIPNAPGLQKGLPNDNFAKGTGG